jgi:hypothetical protein
MTGAGPDPEEIAAIVVALMALDAAAASAATDGERAAAAPRWRAAARIEGLDGYDAARAERRAR